MFEKQSREGYRTPLAGIRMKTLCYGVRTLMTELVLEGGSTVPVHSHPCEQTGYLVSGHIRLTIGAEEHDTQAGDCWCIPSGVEHGARILEDSVAVEVFSPVREDYLPDRARAGKEGKKAGDQADAEQGVREQSQIDHRLAGP